MCNKSPTSMHMHAKMNAMATCMSISKQSPQTLDWCDRAVFPNFHHPHSKLNRIWPEAKKKRNWAQHTIDEVSGSDCVVLRSFVPVQCLPFRPHAWENIFLPYHAELRWVPDMQFSKLSSPLVLSAVTCPCQTDTQAANSSEFAAALVNHSRSAWAKRRICIPQQTTLQCMYVCMYMHVCICMYRHFLYATKLPSIPCSLANPIDNDQRTRTDEVVPQWKIHGCWEQPGKATQA